MNEQSLRPVIEKLESLFSKFNEKFYNNELPKPIITVSPNSRKVNCYGWCTSWKAWSDSDKTINIPEMSLREPTKIENNGFYEINICAEYLSRPFEETCCTLLHEMVHLYNLQHNVQDTSRSGLYHNKQFKKTAEKHGLVVTKGEKYGFHITDLNEESSDFIASIDGVTFSIYREKAENKNKTSPKTSTRKYVCQKCGLTIRATRKVHVLCMECRIELVPKFN